MVSTGWGVWDRVYAVGPCFLVCRPRLEQAQRLRPQLTPHTDRRILTRLSVTLIHLPARGVYGGASQSHPQGMYQSSVSELWASYRCRDCSV